MTRQLWRWFLDDLGVAEEPSRGQVALFVVAAVALAVVVYLMIVVMS